MLVTKQLMIAIDFHNMEKKKKNYLKKTFVAHIVQNIFFFWVIMILF